MTVRLDLSYDGTGFHGYARQRDVVTVQGTLEAALATILGPVETVVAGRTDAGVHARHQVVSFEAPETDLVRLTNSLRRMLPGAIAVHRAIEQPSGFSARFDAVRRSYRYHLAVGAPLDPFRTRFEWLVEHQLDTEAMNLAAGHFVGEHDFASFCRRAEGRTSVRTVHSASFTDEDRGLRFDVVGSAFCHQQVRSLVAYLVDVGRGRKDPSGTPQVLAALDRSAACGVAPPQGLFLWEIAYPDGLAEPPDLP